MDLFKQKKKLSIALGSEGQFSQNYISNSNNSSHQKLSNIQNVVSSSTSPFYIRSSLKNNQSQFKMIKEKQDQSIQELIKTKDIGANRKQKSPFREVSISIFQPDDETKQQAGEEYKQIGFEIDSLNSLQNNFKVNSKEKNIQIDTDKSPKENIHFFSDGKYLHEDNDMLIFRGQQEIASEVEREEDQDSFWVFKNALTRIQIKRNMKKVLNKLYNRRIKMLKQNHYDLINDWSVQITNNTEQLKQRLILIQNIYLKIKEFFRIHSFIDKVKVFNPASKIRLLWDILISINTMTLLYVIPLIVSFQMPIEQIISNYFIRIIQTLQIIDMIIQSNTAFYDKGIIIQNRYRILKFYFKFNFWVDLTGLLSISLLKNIQQINFFHVIFLIFLVKLSYFSQFFKRLEEIFHFKPQTSQLFSLFKLLLQIAIISHFFACLWIFVATVEKSIDNSIFTWLDVINKSNYVWYVKYLYAYYFATVTMVTVGYGDITPQNNIEVIVGVFTIFVSCGVFGYSINQLGSIFQNLQKRGNQIRKNMYIINSYMQKKGIPDLLQFQVREYLDYIWNDISSDSQQGEQSIIKSLSESLQSALLYEANKMIVSDFIFFNRNFSQEFLLKLVSIVNENKFSPGEIIFAKDYEDDCSMYFIESGRVESCLFDFSKNKVVQTLQVYQKGSNVGLYSFITEQKQNFTVRSIDFTSVLSIKRQDFINLLQGYAEDFERFCQIKDEVAIEQNKSSLHIKCLSCGFTDHSLDLCPFIHFIPNSSKQLFLLKLSKIKENNKQKFNTLINQTFYTSISNIFILQNNKKTQIHKFSINLKIFIEKIESFIKYKNRLKALECRVELQQRNKEKRKCEYLYSLQQFYKYKIEEGVFQFIKQNDRDIEEYYNQYLFSNENIIGNLFPFYYLQIQYQNQYKDQNEDYLSDQNLESNSEIIEEEEELESSKQSKTIHKNLQQEQINNLKLQEECNNQISDDSLRQQQQHSSKIIKLMNVAIEDNLQNKLLETQDIHLNIAPVKSIKLASSEKISNTNSLFQCEDHLGPNLQSLKDYHMSTESQIDIPEESIIQQQLNSTKISKNKQNINQYQSQISSRLSYDVQISPQKNVKNVSQQQGSEQENQNLDNVKILKQPPLNVSENMLECMKITPQEQQQNSPLLQYLQNQNTRSNIQQQLYLLQTGTSQDSSNSINKLKTSIENGITTGHTFKLINSNFEKSPKLNCFRPAQDVKRSQIKYLLNQQDQDIEHLSPQSLFPKSSNQAISKLDINENILDPQLKKYLKQNQILQLNQLNEIDKGKILNRDNQTYKNKNIFQNNLPQRVENRKKTGLQSNIQNCSEHQLPQQTTKSNLKGINPSFQTFQNQEQMISHNSQSLAQKSLIDNQLTKNSLNCFGSNSNQQSSQKLQISQNGLQMDEFMQYNQYDNYLTKSYNSNLKRLEEAEFYLSFEQQKNFKNYFIKFNMPQVIQRFIKYVEKRKNKSKLQQQKLKKICKTQLLRRNASLQRKDTKQI